MSRIDILTRYLYAGRPRGRSLILMYHGTPPKGEAVGSLYNIAADRFREQMDFLKAGGWRTGTVSELENADSRAPADTVYITFDDGFSNNYEGAYLPLRERGMVATWYLVSARLGHKSNWVENAAGDSDLMTPAQIRDLAEAGMEIGSHSRSHPHLESLEETRLREEVEGSKNQLEDMIGKPVRSFAYPFGGLNDSVVAAVAAAGYQSACTVRAGWHNPAESRLLLRRVTVFADDTLKTFARKLAFGANEVSTGDILRYYRGRLRAKFGGG